RGKARTRMAHFGGSWRRPDHPSRAHPRPAAGGGTDRVLGARCPPLPSGFSRSSRQIKFSYASGFSAPPIRCPAAVGLATVHRALIWPFCRSGGAMGKISVHEFYALDGVFDSPTWTADFGFDPKMADTIGAITGSSSAILLGRTTFEMFAPAWSTRTVE